MDTATIRHGECTQGGADIIAQYWARQYDGLEDDPMPADWEKYGKPAGHIRNQEMVDKEPQPDVCLAFFKSGAANRGTQNCVDKAVAAGIPVKKFYG